MSYIWVPRAKIIEPRDPVTLTTGMAGEFRFQVYRADGSLRHDTGFFPNLITNIGLNAPGSGASYTACSVGTGNATPANTDTTLQTRIATTSTIQAASYAEVGTPGDPDWYTSYTQTFRFGQGVAAGNLQEVGITLTGSPFTAYSRALILDGGGSPTTLTILASEFLDVSYRHRWYAGGVLTDVATTVTISGNVHDIVLRRAEVDGGSNHWRPVWMWQAGNQGYHSNSNGVIGAITGTISGTLGSATSGVNASYTADTYFREWTSTWGLNDGNVSGGTSAFFVAGGTGRVSPGGGGSSAAAYQFSIDPVVTKDSTKIMTMTWRQTWARHTI